MTLPPIPTQLTGRERVNSLLNTAKTRDVANLANLGESTEYTATGTLVADDFGKVIHVNSATPVSITVPANVFSVGTFITLLVLGTGSLTFVEGAGTNIKVPAGKTLVGNAPRYKFYQLYQFSANNWVLVGDLA